MPGQSTQTVTIRDQGAIAARTSALASSLAHSAGPFMLAIRQPSRSTSSVTGRPSARPRFFSSLNSDSVFSR